MRGDHKGADIRQDGGEAAKLMDDSKARCAFDAMRAESRSLRSRAHDHNTERRQAKEKRQRGSFANPIPPTASAATTIACKWCRCGASILVPVAMSRPAVAAKNPAEYVLNDNKMIVTKNVRPG